MKHFVLTLPLALTLFAGCGTVTDSTSPTVGNTESSLSTAIVVKADDLAEGYQPQGTKIPNALNEAGTTIQGLVGQYKAGSITAEALSEGADEIIEANAQDPVLRVTVPQLVSHATLTALLEGEDAKNALAYIARHAESMVNNNSPHADVISEAMEALEGHWTNEQAATVASKAVDNAEYFFTRDKAHMASKAEGNMPSGEVAVQQFDDNRSRSKSEIGSGVEALEKYLAE